MTLFVTRLVFWRARIMALGGLLALMAGPCLALPPLWIVRDADSELVLFGSVHVLPADLDWQPPALGAALRKADDVWFELPIDPGTQSRVAQLALEKGLLPKGVYLSQKLSAAGRERLGRVAVRAGLRPEQLEPFKPWLAEASLSVADFQRQGARATAGVEQVLAAELGPDVQRRAFETPAEQIDFLANVREEEQLASLEETLRRMDEEPDTYETLLGSWMASDLVGLDREALQPVRVQTPTLYGTLIRDRNRRWVEVIKQRMEGHGRTVVIVGVGHLLGHDGVPERLRQLGYRVEGP
ncbi:MAG: hypothetical protein RLZZ141_436 [Pseudomonadota bacterium]